MTDALELVSIEEAAKAISPSGALTPGMLRKWIQRGFIPSYRPGKDRFVDLADVKAFILKSRDAPPSPHYLNKSTKGRFTAKE